MIGPSLESHAFALSVWQYTVADFHCSLFTNDNTFRRHKSIKSDQTCTAGICREYVVIVD
jgi:hypothetical protein